MMAGDDKASKRRPGGLGRGLSALLGEDTVPEAAPRNARELPIEKLHPNRYQPRTHFDEAAIEDLASSIRARGILQPILVRPLPGRPGEYEIVAGERRWRAAQRARLHAVPVVEKALSDTESLEIAIVENVQRQDLSPIDEARGYRRLVDEFGHSQQNVAEVVGKSRPHVANMMRLLTLPEKVQGMLDNGALSMGHARALVTSDNAEWLAGEIVEKGLNVRQAEELARETPRSGGRGPLKPMKDADTRALEKQLSAALGLPVAVDHKGPAGGSLTIRYKTLDQLDEITAKLAARGR
ncbi:ParB/RepB/Spo0J family partition protein [Iodidimonas sp. SYSU 1G8]|uniref:ParB/RepB/Spo0J family partition protein n=1 Tax=Iodidimonas sp. SYSU 1G8 TaxID=3133967 RepID=UPI0031FEBDAF